MATFNIQKYCFLFLLCNLICQWQCEAAEDERKVYIVYMGALPEGHHTSNHINKLQDQHLQMLQQVVDQSFTGNVLVKSYKRSFNGFAAYLTKQEQEKLASHEDVVSVFPSRTLRPQTTRSWDFIGLSENVVRNTKGGSDIIIGVIDSGITPESESFSDEGFGPIPKKWKGVCNGGQNFTCNKKLIGARSYIQEFFTPNSTALDDIGHGTHTASTAGGNFVKGASFYGIAEGTARGGVPSARIAAYKVCNQLGCDDSAILSAFDDAVADGVDIITISVGAEQPAEIKGDSIAIGSLHAIQKGILTTHSAGNSGGYATVSSVAPWLFTVAASTMDRGIATKVILGDGKTLVGKSVNSFKINGTKIPLVYGKDVTTQCDEVGGRNCDLGCLDRSKVEGKVVLCDNYQGVREGLNRGALGVIAQISRRSPDVSFVVPLPALALLFPDLKLVQSYVNSTKGATAFISTSESIKNTNAPSVASFSSKGPNAILPNILKPDITAPGVEILAAFSPTAPLSDNDKRSVKYSILSGTSMSCPHVAGAAAFVKIAHPDWSPSAIKSALMTTAWLLDPTKNKYKEFAYGAGHISPINATNPGLVYETSNQDYINILCTMGYSVKKLFQNNRSDCSNIKKAKELSNDLNYPSMTYKVGTNAPISASFSRTVTNVGLANSTYTAKISKPSGIDITVEPATLSFKQLNEKKSFVVTVKGGPVTKSMVTASLVWSDGVHFVRSPIVLY